MERRLSAASRFGNTVSTVEEARRQQSLIILLYLAITILLVVDRWANGMLLSQLQPSFFVTPMNISTWSVMYTGVHKFFIENKLACTIADILLVLLPVVYTILHFTNRIKARTVCGWLILIFNWVYVHCYVIYPSNSIEGHIGWILFPLVLIWQQMINVSFALHFIRYVFLFFFASAGIWKIRNGGVFNIDEMSGILLFQHTPLLITNPGLYLSKMYYWLINHPGISYFLYLGATLMDFFFLVGFFTKKLDKILLCLFFVFLVSDIIVMQIKYWEVLYLAIPLFFSNKAIMKLIDK